MLAFLDNIWGVWNTFNIDAQDDQDEFFGWYIVVFGGNI